MGVTMWCAQSQSPWANCLNSSPLKGGLLSDMTTAGTPSAAKSSLKVSDGLEMMCRCHWKDVWELAEVVCHYECAFFPNGLERSQHLFLPKVWGGPHGVSASQLVDCCTRCMWDTAFDVVGDICFHARPVDACSGQVNCFVDTSMASMEVCHDIVSAGWWNDHSVHPWSGCHHWWKVCHGSSSKILLLWEHNLVCQGNRSRVSLCTIERMGVPLCLCSNLGQMSSRGEGKHWYGIDLEGPTWFQCWFWIGRWLRASTRSISLPGQYVMTTSYCCRWRSILWRHAGATVRFFRLIISRGLWSMSPQWMSFCIGTCMEFFTTIYNGQEFSLDVGIMGLSVRDETCLQKQWAVHPGWCRLLAHWVRHHTGGWPVCSDHSISGVSGGLSAVGTLFSGSMCWCSCPRQISFPFWGGPRGAQCSSWDKGWMSAGNLLLQGMIVALASSGVVSSRRCLEFSLDLGSIPLQRRLHQRMLQTPVLWCIFCCWRWVLFGPHWTSL